MDAWLRNLMKTVSGASGSSSSSSRRREPEILLCKRSGSASSSHTVVAASTSVRAPLQTPTATPTTTRCSSPSRIAHWDKKREKCRNCSLIYLKTLSRHPGFCSVDCKSNAAYLDKVNRTIRAMKDAVEQQQQEEAAAAAAKVVVSAPQVVAADEQQQPVVAEDESESCNESELAPRATANTFSEFGLESRILDASNVEWAFSALY